MKILKRIVAGILFLPVFLGALLLGCPVCWIFTGDFDYPIHAVIDFYQDL
jgi:hypothetical protein